MGYARRCLLAVVLFTMLTATVAPALPGDTAFIDPDTLVLPGKGQVGTMHLEVVQDSVVFRAALSVEGAPAFTHADTPVDRGNTIAFTGDSPFFHPDPDLSWYLGDPMSGGDLDSATLVDGEGVRTNASDHAFQVFFVDVDPVGLHDIRVDWTGWANATVDNDTAWGARMTLYDNTSKAWEDIAYYDGAEGPDQWIKGGPAGQPWHYVNRTLSGKDKVIVLVQSLVAGNASLYTDQLEVTYTYATYPLPRMDVGGDGRVDWGFGTSPATGDMGRLSAFSDNRTWSDLQLPLGGGHNDSASLLIPPGVHVQGAYLDYVPFSTEGLRQRQGYAAQVPGNGSSPDLRVTGIPPLSHQRISQVVLDNVIKLNQSEQASEVMDEAIPLNVGKEFINNQSVAQTFTPAFDGPLTGIDLFIHSQANNPGNLTIQVRQLQTGAPTGTLLASATLEQHEVQMEEWNHFTFPPVQVQAGTQYAIRVHTFEAEPTMLNSYRLGYDQTEGYTRGRGMVSASLDGSSAWTPVNLDLMFRTYMDFPVDAVDARNLSVLGRAGTMVGDRVFMNVSGFEYEEGNWTFTVENGNAFDVVLDWTAWTRYLLFAESPSLDVGGDGTVEWLGGAVSNVTPLNITEGLQRVVDTPEWPLVQEDPFGNELLLVPINLSATSEGRVALRNLVVYWNGSVVTTDMSTVVNALKGTYPVDGGGNVNITVNVTSKNAGTLTVTWVDLQYDLPPYSLPFPDVVVDEDKVSKPLNLDSVIFDDHDNNDLNYTVVRESGDGNVSFDLAGGKVLTFWGPANWSGSAVFHVEAVDGSNLTYVTNAFTVTVRAVPDPPLLVGLELDQVAYFDVLMQVGLTILDNDSDPEDITIVTSSPRVWGDVANSSLYMFYPNGTSNELVEVNVSDGEAWSLYVLNVTVEESNEPPVIAFPPGFSFNLTLDAQGVLDLTPYASDLESPAEALVWSVVSSPQELVVAMHDGHMLQVIPVATVKGTHVVVLAVTDPDENVAQGQLTVGLRVESRHDPVILRGDDALPRIVKVAPGGKAEINLALQKYWYDQEDYNQPQLVRWEAESLRPNLFTVELDANHKLTIKAFEAKGAGYFTLLLIDGDEGISSKESVQVVVEEPESAVGGWLTYAIAAIVLLVVVAALMVASRARGAAPKVAKAAKVEVPEPRPTAAVVSKERRPKPPAKRDAPAAPVAAEAAAPPPPAPGRILEVLVIHESTSLIAQKVRGPDDALPPLKEDDLIEMSTLFAQDRFEGAKVRTIKAFKFNGDEVLVGKGMNYFLAVRCSGTEFDEVVEEMKRSIVNIDVNLGDKLSKWYPGQKVTPLEEELRELLSGGD